MQQLADIWSSLGDLPAVVATLIAGALVAVIAFVLSRLGKRADDRAESRKGRPSRRAIRAAQKHLTSLAARPRNVAGAARWSLTFNTSLSAYEVEQHGPDDTHDVRIDVIDARTAKQTQPSPTVRIRVLPSGIPLTMGVGATSRVQHLGLVIRWDDSFGVDQLERLRFADAYRD